MIRIKKLSASQNMRLFADLIEPLAVKQIQKQQHTFFAYRCSDYIDIYHLAKCHDFNLKRIKKFLPLLEVYWSSIDIIYFHIENIPAYTKSKLYFDFLKQISKEEKNVVDFQLYEVKLTSRHKDLIISKRTFELMKKLEETEKELLLIEVVANGNISLDIKSKKLSKSNYRIRTHYGRKGFCLKGTSVRD